MATAQGQVNKGSVLPGTDIGCSQIKTDQTSNTDYDVKIKTFTVSPSVARAIKENVVAGIRFNYLSNTQKSYYDPVNTYIVEQKIWRQYILSPVHTFGEPVVCVWRRWRFLQCYQKKDDSEL